jgi:hypothetical protein
MARSPRKVCGADLLVWATINETITSPADCGWARRSPDDARVVTIAICVSGGDVRHFHLFHCDQAWRVLAQSDHDTLELAQRQAETEYPGVSAFWRASLTVAAVHPGRRAGRNR